MPRTAATKTKKDGHKPKKETAKALGTTAQVEVIDTPETAMPEAPQVIIPPQEAAIQETPEAELIPQAEYELVPQPQKDAKGHISKEDQKKYREVLLWHHPKQGQVYIEWTRLVPGPNQRPYFLRDKMSWFGLKWPLSVLFYGFDKAPVPFYSIQEVKVNGVYQYATYEDPEPVSLASMTPSRFYHKTDWKRWKRYIVYQKQGWKEIIKIASAALIIIVVCIIFYLSWKSWILGTPGPSTPKAPPAASAPAAGVK